MISHAPDRPWSHPGAVLCGGRSRRMGVPKAGMLLPDGRSMLQQTRDILATFCERVVLLGTSGRGSSTHASDEQPAKA